MKRVLCMFCILNFFVANAQINLRKDKWNWHFGYQCALSFSTGVPVGGTSAINSFEGSASISSSTTGSLLFYTDGTNVWNKNNNLMPNGTGLFGDKSSTQSAVIVPFPNDTTKYYIFTTDQGGYLLGPPNKGAYYSVVDMTLNGGLGDIVIKNILILTAPVTEKIVAVRACNGIDSWVITHKFNSDGFYAYPITNSGVGSPVITNIGTVHNNGSTKSYETVGCMAASNDGNKLAITIYDNTDLLELFDFDRLNGVVSNSISINKSDIGMTVFQPYGLIFSQDNSKLYVTHSDENFSSQNSNLMQFNIGSWNKSSIISSMYVVSTLTNNCYYTLALGPDDKVYATKYSTNQQSLDVINNPNLIGAACGFSLNAVNIPSSISVSRGLPNYMSEKNENSPGSCQSLVINNNYIYSKMKLYPNPASESVFFKTEFDDIDTLRIYDVLGRELFVKYLKGADGIIEINTESLTQGAYILKCSSLNNNKEVITRFVISE